MGLSTKEFMEIRESLNTQCEALMVAKGREYAQSDIEDNRLNNFSRIAERLNSTPYKVLLTYLMKHMDALEKWVRTGAEGSEPIDTRVADLRNYVDLFYGMMIHERRTFHQPGERVELKPGENYAPTLPPIIEPTIIPPAVARHLTCNDHGVLDCRECYGGE